MAQAFLPVLLIHTGKNACATNRIPVLTPAQFVGLCFGGLCCLAPVSFYFCWLAGVNRRPHPTAVAGAWDFVGVMAALSGFLLAGGLLLLGVAVNDPRFLTGGTFDKLRDVWERQWLTWLLLLIGYTVLVGGGIALGIRGRRHALSVYNLDADTAGRVVTTATERAGLTAKREGNLWTDSRPLVETHTFHATAHTTLKIVCPEKRVREDLERHLRSEILGVACEPSPAAAWFTSAAVGSVIFVVGVVGMIAWFVFTGR